MRIPRRSGTALAAGPVPGWVLRLALGALWVGALALITLTPGTPAGPHAARLPSVCLICGTRGLSDAVLNTVLFLPLGLVLGVRRGVGTALAAGLLMSAGIESVQLLLDGRNASLGDVFWNGMGAALGAQVTLLFRSWLVGPVPPRRAGVTATGLGILYLALAGALLAPRGTDAPYYGQWTADLGYLDPYRGTLLAASLNGRPIPPGPYPPGDSPRQALEGDFVVEARVVKGAPPRGIAPVVSIYDAEQREILLLGAHRDDVVFRERARAQAARLDFHDLRAPGLLSAWGQGDTVQIAATRIDGVLCLRVEADEACGVGMTPGRTWALLMNLEGAPPWLRALLDAAWMATLFLLVGLLGGGAASTARLTGVAALAVTAVVAATPLVGSPALEWAGMAAGVWAGAGARPLVRAFVGSAGSDHRAGG